MESILIKSDELTSLVNYLNEIPHKYAKEILIFLSNISEKRKAEIQDEKGKPKAQE